ncbi:hypothetical protein PG995_007688 [Apiospora arundinis]
MDTWAQMNQAAAYALGVVLTAQWGTPVDFWPVLINILILEIWEVVKRKLLDNEAFREWAIVWRIFDATPCLPFSIERIYGSSLPETSTGNLYRTPLLNTSIEQSGCAWRE